MPNGRRGWMGVQGLGQIGGALGQMAAQRLARPQGPQMSEEEKREAQIRQVLIQFGKQYGWTDVKTSDLLRDYLAQPTSESRQELWRERTAGLPLFITKNLEILRSIREQPTRAGYFGAPFTPAQATQLTGGLAGEPAGMLGAEVYGDPLARMRQQFPGLAAQAPGVFGAGVERRMGEFPERKSWTKEQIALGELRELPTEWRRTLEVAKGAQPKLYYQPQAVEQARMEFPTEREKIAFDTFLEQIDLPEAFTGLDTEFLSGIGIEPTTKKVITPTLEGIDDNEARFVRKMLITQTNPPESDSDLLKVAAFLYGKNALRPTMRDVMLRWLDSAAQAGAVMPPTEVIEGVVGPPSRSQLEELVYGEPAVNLPKKDQIERAIALRGTGLYDERTIAYIFRLIGTPDELQTAYNQFKMKGILTGAPTRFEEIIGAKTPTAKETVPTKQLPVTRKAGNILDDITKVIGSNPDITAEELARQLKTLGWSDAEIRNIGIS